MNKYDIEKLLVDNEIVYPNLAEDERSVKRRCREKKDSYCLIQKQKSQ